MVFTTCNTCGGYYDWNWMEAFEKFGFNDGDGQVETWTVSSFLEECGYDVHVVDWGLHNTVIVSVKKDDMELVPENDLKFNVGHDCPRTYLPEDLIKLLDEEFPPS